MQLFDINCAILLYLKLLNFMFCSLVENAEVLHTRYNVALDENFVLEIYDQADLKRSQYNLPYSQYSNVACIVLY